MPHSEKTRIVSQLLGSQAMASEEDGSSVEEINQELEELGFDVKAVDSRIADFRRRMEGIIAMRKAATARKAAEDSTEVVFRYPESQEEMDEALRVAEDQLSSRGYGIAARKKKDLGEQDKRELLRTYRKLLDDNDAGE